MTQTQTQPPRPAPHHWAEWVLARRTGKPCRLKVPCQFCGAVEGAITPTGCQHPAKVLCWQCGNWLKWLNRAEANRANKLGLFTPNQETP